MFRKMYADQPYQMETRYMTFHRCGFDFARHWYDTSLETHVNGWRVRKRDTFLVSVSVGVRNHYLLLLQIVASLSRTSVYLRQHRPLLF